MKAKTRKRIRGSITIMMVIILLPMMTLSAIIVDFSRINMARGMVSSAGDLTMNAALANYDTILKDVYGLFAMSQNQTDEELSNSLREYFCQTLVGYGVTNEADADDYLKRLGINFQDLVAGTRGSAVNSANFMEMDVLEDAFHASGIVNPDNPNNSSLANPELLRTQIVEYTKYRAPIHLGLSFLDSIKLFQNVQGQTDVVEKQVIAQESTQDVTKACQNLIKEIRSFDEMLDHIQGKHGNIGDAIKGLDSPRDGQIVTLMQYPKQVDKYAAVWGEKYKDSWNGRIWDDIGSVSYWHINVLAQVFLLKPPSTDTLYLRELNHTAGEYFIRDDGAGLLTGRTGIPETVVNYALDREDTEAAGVRFREALDELQRTGNGTAKETAKNYLDNEYLPRNCVNWDYSAFEDEDGKNREETAIEAFIAYEQFLESGNGYGRVKTALEQIYELWRLYEAYDTLLRQEVQAAEEEKNAAQQEKQNADNNANRYANQIILAVNGINEEKRNFGSLDFLSGMTDRDGRDIRANLAQYLGREIVLPSGTVNVGGKNATAYRDLHSENEAMTYLRSLLTATPARSEDNAAILSAATRFLGDVETGRTDKSFEVYLLDETGLERETLMANRLYQLARMLYAHNVRFADIDQAITNYEGAYQGYGELERVETEKTTAYNSKVVQRNSVQENCYGCLSGYREFTNRYQTDIFFYLRYINTARETVSRLCADVNGQFTQMKENIKKIVDKYSAIEEKIDAAHSAIEAYSKKVDDWAKANSQYEGSSGQDSFSEQNDTDISTSRSQYDLNSLERLKTYVQMQKKEYQDFYNILENVKFGQVKLDQIQNADQVVSSLGGVKDALPAVITPADAWGTFAGLYPSVSLETPDIEGADQPFFLDPIKSISFLVYLDSTFPPKTAENSDGGLGTPAEKTERLEKKGQYEDTKEALKTGSGGSESFATPAGPSYTYSGKTMPGNLPSDNMSQLTIADEKFKLSESGEKVNVSSSFSTQKSALDKILNGLGNAAEGAMENAYILTYLFENFSYNTRVQELALKGEKVEENLKDKGFFPIYEEARSLMGDANRLDRYLGSAQMLSNFPLNDKNNYLYGAEVEYILYGNKDAAKNVTYAKGSIYAVRFAFDCIFAFTNSEIRNTARSVGMAVQTATLGVVPYQLVQIVMQLAMAAGEAALDLDAMSHGMKVVVVKTKDTWTLSPSGVVDAVKGIVVNEAVNAAERKVQNLTDGLQAVVDASAEELSEAVQDLGASLDAATKAKAEEIVDGAFETVEASIEEELNKLQFLDESVASLENEVNSVFDRLGSEIEGKLDTKFSGNPVADKVLPFVKYNISEILSSVRKDIIGRIHTAQDVHASAEAEVRSEINEQMWGIKQNLLNQVKYAVASVTSNVTQIVQGMTTDIKNQINEEIANAGERATEIVRENVTNWVNDFSESILDGGGKSIGGGAENISGTGSSALASAIRFGYKDYLMLFTFVNLCIDASSKAILARTADLIQVNLQHCDKDASYQHKKGAEFQMENARTYLSINAEVRLHMLFLNMNFFTRMVSDGQTEVEGDLTPAATIKYRGLYGY